ncbi:NAD(P)H-hydrate dehydratase [Iodobacter fluviatilis]|uniref:Bifunctional NAD(P)H-hydrate repair enzyme n=1 Tax=Iodobacter fluviatilis TaxID=537 RepID=A0A7G3G8S7_9NEIS|nr:NAD(P)H-hydrate dehydratase [Iodobacter fluviatilis]QBC43880.1 bifunctional ADP-dependent NAD(P)H-hydrate dehydratase/NAD(P)H-hydrate epimerase [Iodobacter fluviatilis]
MKNAPLFFSHTLRQIETAAASLSLMQRAGKTSTQWVLKHYPNAQNIYVLAGSGNNGGDALLTAKQLRHAGKNVFLRLSAPVTQPDAQQALSEWLACGGQIQNHTTLHADLAIDGLYGIGLNRVLSATDSQIIQELQALACPIIALDIPSGLMADNGAGNAVQATHTLSFIAHKPGQFTGQGCNACGDIHLLNLQISQSFYPEPDGYLQTIAPSAIANLLRKADSHKGSYGTVGIIGGATAMVGATLLAGRAALKLGAGRVVLGLLDKILSVDPTQPELMLHPAAAALQHPALTMLVIGPGLGTSQEAMALVQQSIASPLPLLLDADALNLLASTSQLAVAITQRSAATILTPHPAEAARLLQTSTAAVQANRIAAAKTIAERYHATVLLKGAGSICTDGQSWSINGSGNAALASAGQGDVLSGIIAALIAQGLAPLAAVRSGCWLHGRAAEDWCRENLGGIGLSASETIIYARAALNHALATCE